MNGRLLSPRGLSKEIFASSGFVLLLPLLLSQDQLNLRVLRIFLDNPRLLESSLPRSPNLVGLFDSAGRRPLPSSP